MRISDWSSDVCSSDLQFEYLASAMERLKVVVPIALVIIFLLIYAVFRRVSEAALIMARVPLALVGGLWLIWLLGHAVSEIGRASGRERVGRYGVISVGAVSLKKKKRRESAPHT